MKKIFPVLMIIVCLLICGFTALVPNSDLVEGKDLTICSRFAGGNGTVMNPYQISNVTGLQLVNMNLSANYTLRSNVYAIGTKWWNGGAGFLPIGNFSNPFIGSLDGNGFEIRNLFIDRPSMDYVGLFGYLGAGSTVKDLGLAGGTEYILTGNDFVGGLAGQNNGTISNCSTHTGLVTGNDYVGGLIGRNNGTIADCYDSVDPNGNWYVGGLVGCNDYGRITNSHSLRYDPSGTRYFGGFVGSNEHGSITNCYSTKPSLSGESFIGGFAGYNNGKIIDSYSTGTADGDLYIGSFAGQNNGTIIESESINDATGTGSTRNYIGGFVGRNYGSINNCTSIGSAFGYDYVGSFAGQSNGVIMDCYSRGDPFGADDYVGGFVGDNTGLIMNCDSMGDTFGDDFVGGFAGRNNGSILNCYNSHGSTSGDEYVGGFIGCNDNGAISYCHNSDGSVNGDDFAGGFIGWNHDGIVTYCHNSDGSVNGDDSIGGFAGWNDHGNITHCHSTGPVDGDDSIGGFIGWHDNGNISDCHSTGRVNADEYVGGFAGWNDGMIANGFAKGDVTGTGANNLHMGGFVGRDFGTIRNCFSTGRVEGRSHIGSFAGYTEGTILDSYSNGGVVCDINVMGGFAGRVDGTITNCYSTGTMGGSPNSLIGGFVGNNIGTISESYSTVEIFFMTADVMGGFVGNNAGTITHSYSTGSVRGDEYIGGFAGTNTDIIDTCYTVGRVTGQDYAGGFIGHNLKQISNCYSDGKVEGLDEVGGFVGRCDGSSGIFFNCYSNGTVEGRYFIGGFAGYNEEGKVTDCYTTASVDGDDYLGGFVGDNLRGTYSNCFSTGSVLGTGNVVSGFAGQSIDGEFVNCYGTGSADGTSYVGGFAAYSFDDIISNCYSTGKAVGTGNYIGGFAGVIEDSTVKNCYSTGSANGVGYVGGFSGSIEGKTMNCYGTGSATGNNLVGGFAGYNDDEITACYSAGAVNGATNTGGFLGDNNLGTITDCFWDNITSSWTTSDGGSGKNTTHMMQQATFTNWNFTTPWGIVENSTYPYFTNITPIISAIYYPSVENIIEDQLYWIFFDSKAHPQPSFNKIENWTIATNSTGWLTINASTGLIYGTPTNADVGYWYVNVSVKDTFGNGDHHNFTLIVENIEPIITTSDNTTAIATIPYSNDYACTDDGQGTITWSLNTNASWLSINASTGVLSGMPPNNLPGDHWVEVTVDDGNGGVDSTNFTVTVIDVNDDPIIITEPKNSTLEDDFYLIIFEATDADPGVTIFTWNLETNAGWLELNDSRLQGLPNNSDVGMYWVNISVLDGVGGLGYVNYSLQVDNTNDEPTITTIPQTTATEDIEYSQLLSATDPDTGDPLEWTLISGPAWLALIDAKLEGTPRNEDVGINHVTIEVNDSAGATDHLSFSIDVANTNDGPVIITLNPSNTTKEDELYSIFFTAMDEDPGITDLIWNLNTGADWLSLVDNNLFGTPENINVGECWINITVSDGTDLDWLNYTLTVVNTNDLPVINCMPVTAATEDQEYSMTLSVEEVDSGDSVLWSIASGPDWLVLNGSKLEGTPRNDDVGINRVTIEAKDSSEAADYLSFSIDVANTNDDPIWDSVPTDQNITEYDAIILTVLATDPDVGDTIEYSISSAPNVANLTIGSTSGRIIWPGAKAGSYKINLTATDGIAMIYSEFDIVIKILSDATQPDENKTTPEPGPNSTTDTDQDGIPDWWEEFYGLDPNDPSDAGDDPDSDGTTNLEEYTARTSPTKDNRIPDDGTDGGSTDGGGGNGADGDGSTDSHNMGYLVAIISLIVLLIAAIGAAVFFMLKGNEEKTKEELEDDIDEDEGPKDPIEPDGSSDLSEPSGSDDPSILSGGFPQDSDPQDDIEDEEREEEDLDEPDDIIEPGGSSDLSEPTGSDDPSVLSDSGPQDSDPQDEIDPDDDDGSESEADLDEEDDLD